MDKTSLARSLKINRDTFRRLVKAQALPAPKQGKYYSPAEIRDVLVQLAEYDSWLTQAQMADVLDIDISHYMDLVSGGHLPAPTHRKGTNRRLHYATRDIAKLRSAYQTYRARLDARPDNPCTRCRHREADHGFKTCEHCRTSQREAGQQRQRQGKCRQCRNQAAEGHTVCHSCLERMRVRERERRTNVGQKKEGN